MLIIIEIFLTIWAWRKGWKSKALIPICSGFGIGILIGIVITAINGNLETIGPWIIIADSGVIVVLIYMISTPKIEKGIEKKD